MLAVINDTGILVVLVALIFLFGASQIPKLARNLGEASREFRKAHEDAAPATPAAPAQDQVTISRSQLDALRAAAAAGNQNSPATQTPSTTGV